MQSLFLLMLLALPVAADAPDPTSFVDPRIGTGRTALNDDGNTWPGRVCRFACSIGIRTHSTESRYATTSPSPAASV